MAPPVCVAPYLPYMYLCINHKLIRTRRYFPIVILDECSQMVEPVSLGPIVKSRCQKLIAVGDPMQLAPITRVDTVTTVQYPGNNAPGGVGGGVGERGKVNCVEPSTDRTDRTDRPWRTLSWTIFERLAAAGVPTQLLSTQYRCHPLYVPPCAPCAPCVPPCMHAGGCHDMANPILLLTILN